MTQNLDQARDALAAEKKQQKVLSERQNSLTAMAQQSLSEYEHLERHRQASAKCGKYAADFSNAKPIPLRPPTFRYTFWLEKFRKRCHNLCSQFSRPTPTS